MPRLINLLPSKMESNSLPSTFLSRLLAYGVRFCISGGIATLCHFALMALLIHWQINPLQATAAGATLGAVVNYVLQFHFTFAARARHQTALPAYLVTVAAGWLLNLILFRVFLAWLDGHAAPAQVLTTALITVLNMIWYKRFVFHDRIVAQQSS